jgi:hypothetical protein
MSDAGAAQKRPALRGGPSLALGVVVPRSHSPAMLPRPASPRSQIWASQLYRVFRDEPYEQQRYGFKAWSSRESTSRLFSLIHT